MQGNVWPQSRAVRLVLLLLGLVPLGEVVYLAGPKVLLPIAGGVLFALALGGSILWRVESDVALEHSAFPKGALTPTPDKASPESEPMSLGFMAWMVVFVLLLLTLPASDGFQPVEKTGDDYLISWSIALAIFFVIYLPRRAPARSVGRRRRSTLAFGIACMVAFFGRAVFFAFNAALDRGASRSFVGIIERVGCSSRGASTWWLRGAPSLPTEDNRMSITGAGCGQFEGDSVIVEVRPGRLGRPWIARYERR